MLRHALCWVGIAFAIAWSGAVAHSQPNKLPTPKYDPKVKQWGYAEGERLTVPAKFAAVLPFSPTEKLAVVTGGEKGREKYWFIDTKGEKKFGQEFDFAGPFREGVARVRKDAKFALLDKNGKNLTDFVYDDLGDAREGLVRAKRDGTYRFLRTSGVEAFKTEYALVGDFSNERAWFHDKDGFGYIAPGGRPAFKERFEVANTFSSDLAVVRQDGAYRYIDKTGRFKFDARYQHARPFVGNLAVVQVEKKFGLIDTQGEKVLSPEYDQLEILTPTAGWARKGKEVALFRRDGKAAEFVWKMTQESDWVSVPITCNVKDLEIYKVRSILFDPKSPIKNYIKEQRNFVGTTSHPGYSVEKYGVWVFIVVSKDKDKSGDPVCKYRYCDPDEPNPAVDVRFP